MSGVSVRQTLQRWLLARKMNLGAAKADLESHASWREANIPNGRISDEEVSYPAHQSIKPLSHAFFAQPPLF